MKQPRGGVTLPLGCFVEANAKHLPELAMTAPASSARTMRRCKKR